MPETKNGVAKSLTNLADQPHFKTPETTWWPLLANLFEQPKPVFAEKHFFFQPSLACHFCFFLLSILSFYWFLLLSSFVGLLSSCHMAVSKWTVSLLNETSVLAVLPDIVCSICHAVLLHPVETKCHHLFCQTCLNTALNSKPECPNCRGALFPADADQAARAPIPLLKHSNPLAFRSLFGTVKVHCPVSKEDGCPWQGEYTAMDDHVASSCSQTIVSCPDCRAEMRRKCLSGHQQECVRRPVPCPLCTKVFPLAKISVHLDDECPLFVVQCGESGPESLSSPSSETLFSFETSSSHDSGGSCSKKRKALSTAPDVSELEPEQKEDKDQHDLQIIDAKKRRRVHATSGGWGCWAKMPRKDLFQHRLTACPQRVLSCSVGRVGAVLRGCQSTFLAEEKESHDRSHMSEHLSFLSQAVAHQTISHVCHASSEPISASLLVMRRDGQKKQRVCAFWVATQQWTEWAEILCDRGEYRGCARTDRFLILVGGNVGGRACDNCECLPLTTDSLLDSGTSLREWLPLTPLPQGRQGAALVVCGLHLFLLGGVVECGSGLPKKTVLCLPHWEPELLSTPSPVPPLDEHEKKWIEIPPMMIARDCPAVVSVGTRLFVFGGWPAATASHTGECFDTLLQKWSPIAALPHARAAATALFYEQRILLFGGNSRCVSVDIYDPQLNTWSTPAWSLPHGGFTLHGALVSSVPKNKMKTRSFELVVVGDEPPFCTAIDLLTGVARTATLPPHHGSSVPAALPVCSGS